MSEPAEAAGFQGVRIQSLQPHYARTLDCGASALSARRAEAVRITSEQVYQRYVRYLTGCAERFRNGSVDVMQFTLITDTEAGPAR